MQEVIIDTQFAETHPSSVSNENQTANEGVKKHLWTQDEYYKMADLGFFHGKRVELIEGEIIEMSPMNKAHATAIRLILESLRGLFAQNYIVDSQLPMSFGKNSEPEPDIAVIAGGLRDFIKTHPKKAVLVIEISDTTLSYDRNRKASLYAKNKIEDYWIVNLNARRIEVYRRPIKDETAFYKFSYAERAIFDETDEVAPLALPEVKIKVAELLP